MKDELTSDLMELEGIHIAMNHIKSKGGDQFDYYSDGKTLHLLSSDGDWVVTGYSNAHKYLLNYISDMDDATNKKHFDVNAFIESLNKEAKKDIEGLYNG